MNQPISGSDGQPGLTTKVADLLPELRAGNMDAIDQLVSLAHERLLQIIRGKKYKFAGGVAPRYYRDDEQTGHIFSELYARLRKAVETEKLTELHHPAGFWKIVADHVRYILLDLARQRKHERMRYQQSFARTNVTELPETGMAIQAAGFIDSNVTVQQPEPNDLAGGDPTYRTEISQRNSLAHVPDYRHETVDNVNLRLDLLGAIGQLEEPHQTVFSMYYLFGKRQSEISELLRPEMPDLYERKVSRVLTEARDTVRSILGQTAAEWFD